MTDNLQALKDLSLERRVQFVQPESKDGALRQVQEYLRTTPPPKIVLIYPKTLGEELTEIYKSVRDYIKSIF